MATSSALLTERQERKLVETERRTARTKLDFGMLTGIAIAAAALFAGIAATGVSARYFLQPTGLLIVLGGTLGVMLVTTPPAALIYSFKRTAALFYRDGATPEELIEEIVGYAKVVRIKGLLALEANIEQVSQSYLQEALLLAMDAKEREELQSGLENRMRFFEKQSDAAARVLEAAAALTPTVGVLGTVIGLIDILRQFSNLSMIASGVGVAFTSTIYGLTLANLVFLPLAGRIRARAEEAGDCQELMTEGALCMFDGTHPRLVRQRLYCLVEPIAAQRRAAPSFGTAAGPERI